MSARILTALALVVAAATQGARAHSHATPNTPEAIAHLDTLRSASYLCAPQIAAFNAQRQRSWAQKVLGGAPGRDKQQLFLDQKPGGAVSWDEVAQVLEAEQSAGGDKKILACNEVETSRIRNHTCVLAPEVTEGPYYHTVGHPIRSNMAELEPGLLFLMNIGVIDVETCEPLPDVLVDIWHCNATGHYAGHPDPAPHLRDEQPASTGHRRGLLSAFPRTKGDDEETWLRAAQPTDENGVAEFTSIFPGYYTGRATHVHTKIHPQWQTLPNGTFISGQMAHTGQFFVPDDLNVRIDKLWPYVTNPIADIRGRTRNWADSLNIFEDSQIGGYQSMFDIQFLGGVLEQGLIGYITVVVNKSADHTVAWSVDQGKTKQHQAPINDEQAQASSVSSAAEERATTGPVKDEL